MTKIELPNVSKKQLYQAVTKVLEQQTNNMAPPPNDTRVLIGRFPTNAQLTEGARDSVVDNKDTDKHAALYFQSLLELAYLVASADGLATEERETLALLVEHATGEAINRDKLLLHFEDLDTTSAVLGRSERLCRVAANLETYNAKEEAISFAALVSIADGTLSKSEMEVLIKMGALFEFSSEEVINMAKQVAQTITAAIQ